MKRPIVFLMGSSSVGKSRILWALKRKGYRIVSADDIMNNVRDQLITRARNDPDAFATQEAFHDALERIGTARYLETLHANRDQMLIVDDTVKNIKKLLPHVSRDTFNILVFAPLARLAQNLIDRDRKRDVRRAADVLDEVMHMYETVPQRPRGKCELSMHMRDLENLDRIRDYKPYGFISQRLPSTMCKFKEHFFPPGRQKVCVRPSSQLGLSVDHVVVHEDTSKAVEVIHRTLRTLWANHVDR